MVTKLLMSIFSALATLITIIEHKKQGGFQFMIQILHIAWNENLNTKEEQTKLSCCIKSRNKLFYYNKVFKNVAYKTQFRGLKFS